MFKKNHTATVAVVGVIAALLLAIAYCYEPADKGENTTLGYSENGG